jgi:hypothetical protein
LIGKKKEVVMQFEFLPNTGLVAAIIALVLGIIMIVKPRIVAYLIGLS